MHNTIILRLRRTLQLDSTLLSCEDFAGMPATVALSEHIRVAFAYHSSPDSDLGFRDLARPALEVWNAVARRLLDAASDFESSSFLVRHVHDRRLPRTIQIKTREADISQWLAHPLLFTSLNSCATKVLGSPDISFHVLGNNCVIATLGEVPDEVLKNLSLPVDSEYFFPRLRYYKGFPVESDLDLSHNATANRPATAPAPVVL